MTKEIYEEIHGETKKSQQFEIEKVNSLENFGQHTNTNSLDGSQGYLRLMTKSSEELPDVHEIQQIKDIMN